MTTDEDCLTLTVSPITSAKQYGDGLQYALTPVFSVYSEKIWELKSRHSPASFSKLTASSILGSVVLGIIRISSNPTAKISFLTSSNITSACLLVGDKLTSIPRILRASKVSFKAAVKFPLKKWFRDRKRSIFPRSSGWCIRRKQSFKTESDMPRSPMRSLKFSTVFK